MGGWDVSRHARNDAGLEVGSQKRDEEGFEHVDQKYRTLSQHASGIGSRERLPCSVLGNRACRTGG